MKTTRLVFYLLIAFILANVIVVLANSLLQVIFAVTTRPGMRGRTAVTTLSTIILFLVSGVFFGFICMGISLALAKQKTRTIINFMSFGGLALSALFLAFNLFTTPGNVGSILSNSTFDSPPLAISYFVGAVPAFFIFRDMEMPKDSDNKQRPPK